MSLPPVIVLVGAVIGLTYGLLGVGLVLVYRSSRFINFAHGDIGAFGAVAMSLLVLDYNVPYWVALPAGLLVAAAVSALVEVLVVRRLRSAPRLMSMVATMGVGQFLFLLTLIFGKAGSGAFFPQPPGMPHVEMQGVQLQPVQVAMFWMAPLAVLVLFVFFRNSRYGIAIRGAAANPDAAAMAGMSPARLTTMTWAIAGLLACITAAVLIPYYGPIGGASLGPTMLVRALAAGVIGRMRNIPVTFAAGIGIGIVDSVTRFWTQGSLGGGFAEVVMLGIILVALLVQSDTSHRDDEKGAWATVQPWAPLPEAVAGLWSVRVAPWLFGGIGLVAALIVPHVLHIDVVATLIQLAGFTIVGLSLFVVTGLSGQLSLGQFAVAAIGALVGLRVSQHLHSDELGIVAATAAGAVTAVVVGIPALRLRGLLLAVTTLAFSLAVGEWFLVQRPPWGFGTADLVGSVRLFGISLSSPSAYWYVAVAALAVALLVTRNVRRGNLGRVLVALRDNEDAARAFSVSARYRKLQSYAIAGGLAGFGGGIIAFSQVSLAASNFPSDQSSTVLVMSVVGGIGLVPGSLFGAWTALPQVINLSFGAFALLTFGWLVLILLAPGGMAALVRPVRDRGARLLGRMHGVTVDEVRPDAESSSLTGMVVHLRPVAASAVAAAAGAAPELLTAQGVSKVYGGVVAVNGVDLTVREGEIVGLIGPNGAGKTSLFECLSGFAHIDAGRVVFAGRDITYASAEARARAGLIRSFQDSALFPTMTVLETVMVAMERRQSTGVFASLIGWQRADMRRRARARDLVHLMGLDGYRQTQVSALSTGTRRIVELTCMLALEPRLLLLDEPSSGIAQREVEALCDVIRGIRRQLGSTMVVIEHDIPLVTALSDRLVTMASGAVIAAGTPQDVLADPAVVESYLGGNPAAIARSGADADRAHPLPRVAAVEAGG